jgi:hypothetical protein
MPESVLEKACCGHVTVPADDQMLGTGIRIFIDHAGQNIQDLLQVKHYFNPSFSASKLFLDFVCSYIKVFASRFFATLRITFIYLVTLNEVKDLI